MKKQTQFSIWYYTAVFVVLLVLQFLFFPGTGSRQEISYKTFKDKVTAGEVARVVILPDHIVGQFKGDKASGDSASANLSSGPTAPWRLSLASIEKEMAEQFTVMRLPDMRDDKLLELLDAAGLDYSGKIESNFLQNFFLNWIFPLLVMIGIWGFAYQRMSVAGKGIMSFRRNKAKIHAEDPRNRVTFQDVAGVDEAVEEVKEPVEFLKNPKKFAQLGGKLPKGVLLVGPPGTGKTLLARAMAGEAYVPFFNLSGSNFVEMFVGVGAARVRDLFQQAKEKAPCIIFIDELDAIGKSRAHAAVIGGGYDERENTLNQLLVEMDGFDPSAGVLIMGATNRPDVLVPALLRLGRFDRQVLVDRPDLNGRIAIFKVQKVSNAPRGLGALGYTLQMPLEDRYLMSKSELLGKIKGLLGRRAAEEIIFGEISTGASNDLEKVAQITRNMIVVYGMSETLPNLSLVRQSMPNFLGQGPAAERRSEKIEQMIDDEVLQIIRKCYEETKKILLEKRTFLDKMAQALSEKEVLDYHEIREILGAPQHTALAA